MFTKLKQRKTKTQRIRLRFLIAAIFVMSGMVWLPNKNAVNAENCPDLKIIFARGSGGVRWKDDNYLEFKARIDKKLEPTDLNYEFLDLDYPAVGVGLDNLKVALGAFLGAGEAYEFGDSVNVGVEELTNIINNGCTNTKYVIGGYSQGAMVVSKSLPKLDAEKVIYAATFGDPKIYLPEGAGLIPAACRGDNLSDYRMYVPDCQAYKGLLGAYVPYEPEVFAGKVGTWCNGHDIFCSSYLSISDHTSYISDQLYEDASRAIVSKITQAFGIKNEYTSPHDTAILIDSTGSMAWMINQFREEAVRLANETFEAGGRVALYDYRDLRDPYEPVARCNFETCTTENFETYLNEIMIDGGGDEAESMLSASVKVMNELSWQHGATKSLVVLTDAPFLSPDIDETTVDDVIALSKTIDPVNIYIITEPDTAAEHPEMASLAEATGGTLTTELGALNLLTDMIMDRYDTLPRVEELVNDGEIPMIEIDEMKDEVDTVTIKFGGSTTGAIVILNDSVLGMVTNDTIIINGLNRDEINNLTLVPINDSRKGEPVEVELPIVQIEEVGADAEADINTDKDTDVNVGADINGDVDTGVDTDVIADTDTNTNISASIEMPTDVEKIIEIIEKTTKTINSDTEDSVLNDGFGYEKENKIDEIIIPKAPDTSIVK